MAVDAEITEYLPTIKGLVDDGITAVVHVVVGTTAVCVSDKASFVSLAYRFHAL